MRPSLIAHAISGLMLFTATVLIAYELLYKKTKIENVQLFNIAAILSIAYGAHSISHTQQEVHYGFNPLEGKF